MKKDSSSYVPSGLENSLRSDHARFVANINIAQRTSREMQNLTRRVKSHEIKIALDFNVAKSVRRENKLLAIKTRYTVYSYKIPGNDLLTSLFSVIMAEPIAN